MSRKKEQKNYLDMIPAKAPHLGWSPDGEDTIALEVENKGMFNRIAQKLFHKPSVTKVHLDKYGSFLWEQMDGCRTVMELAALQKERFGDEVEPLYPRIVKCIQIMESYDFVSLKSER